MDTNDIFDDDLVDEDDGQLECEYSNKTINEFFGEVTGQTFVPYEPLVASAEVHPHPGGSRIVESYPLSLVKPPMPNDDHIYFKPGEFPCKDGKLSTLQEDAVRLAATRFRNLDEKGRPLAFQLSKCY